MKIEMGGNNFDTTIYRKKRREKNIIDKKEITRKRKKQNNHQIRHRVRCWEPKKFGSTQYQKSENLTQ